MNNALIKMILLQHKEYLQVQIDLANAEKNDEAKEIFGRMFLKASALYNAFVDAEKEWKNRE